jgi:hypothetical protein
VEQIDLFAAREIEQRPQRACVGARAPALALSITSRRSAISSSWSATEQFAVLPPRSSSLARAAHWPGCDVGRHAADRRLEHLEDVRCGSHLRTAPRLDASTRTVVRDDLAVELQRP